MRENKFGLNRKAFADEQPTGLAGRSHVSHAFSRSSVGRSNAEARNDFWGWALRFLRFAGRQVLHKALLLYYAAQRLQAWLGGKSE